jgi:hypothetical protein
MTPPLVIAGALIVGLFHASPPQTITKTYGDSGWILKVQTDTFTQQTTCQLVDRNGHSPDVIVMQEALAFRFNSALDTYGAWYKVDQGVPHAWQDQYANLIRAGALANAERLDNSTSGIVIISMAELSGASIVEVRPTSRAKPQSFHLKSLWRLIASADGLGCRFQGAPQ